MPPPLVFRSTASSFASRIGTADRGPPAILITWRPMNAVQSSFAWSPTREQRENSRLFQFIERLGAHDFNDLQRLSRDEPDRFWMEVTRDIGIDWTIALHTIR